MQATTRKRREDRNHVIYLLTNKESGDTYLGLTVVRGSALVKSAKVRFGQHVYNAHVRGLNGLLYQNIRQHGKEAFKVEVVAKVRGKEAAHESETEWIEKIRPTLNMLKVVRK